MVPIHTEAIFHSYYKTKAQTEALITALAILRYKNNTAQFPESLDRLLSTGYLKAIPQDPYSNAPLIYKVATDNFKLYSVGTNFVDDGGNIEPNNMAAAKPPGMHGMPKIFAAVQPRNLDIVYWPVKNWKEEMLLKIREAQKQYEQQKLMQDIKNIQK
jgi:hypothetical protein